MTQQEKNIVLSHFANLLPMGGYVKHDKKTNKYFVFNVFEQELVEINIDDIVNEMQQDYDEQEWQELLKDSSKLFLIK